MKGGEGLTIVEQVNDIRRTVLEANLEIERRDRPSPIEWVENENWEEIYKSDMDAELLENQFGDQSVAWWEIEEFKNKLQKSYIFRKDPKIFEKQLNIFFEAHNYEDNFPFILVKWNDEEEHHEHGEILKIVWFDPNMESIENAYSEIKNPWYNIPYSFE